ncbi:hypothetical protein EGI22_13635 [Lacihabitans sp. LS3-19]|uniref:GIY-YIG nuclease family protein n=5 Tax=Lacihabitans sp. LS3-19 TaxID=2487335 RepID=UPI0020CBDA73
MLFFMNDICCYILFSEKINKFYIGATQSNLEIRIKNHNSHFYQGQHFSNSAEDWNLFLKIPTDNYAHAIRLERKIKSMKSSKYISNLKKYPDLITKILEETKN